MSFSPLHLGEMSLLGGSVLATAIEHRGQQMSSPDQNSCLSCNYCLACCTNTFHSGTAAHPGSWSLRACRSPWIDNSLVAMKFFGGSRTGLRLQIAVYTLFVAVCVVLGLVEHRRFYFVLAALGVGATVFRIISLRSSEQPHNLDPRLPHDDVHGPPNR